MNQRKWLAGLAVAGLLCACAKSPEPAVTAEAAATGNASSLGVTVGANGNEPIVAIGPDGTVYISALQHFYRSGDGGATWSQLAGPVFSGPVNLNSDSSLSIDPGGRIYFSFDWPYAGSTAICTSDDRGDTWACDPVAVPGGTDRMWVAAPANDSAFAVTNEGLYQTVFLQSTDRGTTWLPAKFGSELLEPQTGPLFRKPGSNFVLQPVNLANVTFYVFDPSNPSGVLAEERPTPVPRPVALPTAALDAAGTLYTVGEDARHAVIVGRSTDEALTWTAHAIPQTTSGSATFSWITAGAANHVGVIYFQTPDRGDPGLMPSAVWSAYWAETFNADAAAPTWTVTLLENRVRKGPICAAASCSGDNRFAGDFISAAFDAHENAHLAWMRNKAPGISEIRYARLAH